MLKKIACGTLILLSLAWVAVNSVFNASARTGDGLLVGSVLRAEPHQSRPAIQTIDSPLMAARGAFFALSVANINASAKWYSEKLGLKVVMQPPKTEQSTVIVLEGGGLIVELIQHDEALPLSKAAPAVKDNILVHGIFKVGVIVDDFDKTVVMLKERNVPIVFGPFPGRADQRANVIIRDNDGNLIQFFGK